MILEIYFGILYFSLSQVNVSMCMLVMYVVLITEMSLVAVVQATVVDNLIELVLFRRAEGISKIMPLHLIRNQGDISVYDIVEFIE